MICVFAQVFYLSFSRYLYKYTYTKQINRINRLIEEQDNIYRLFIFKLNTITWSTKIIKVKLIH